MVSEKEFAVIHEISNNHLPDQRTIATRTGISLGLTNLIIKRLITKGYLKAKQLDKKKIQYILTPKGFAEKANKSYNFTLKTIGLLKSVRVRIQDLIEKKIKDGFTDFTICGLGDLADMTEMALKNLSKMNINCRIERSVQSNADNSVVVVATGKDRNEESVDLLKYLSETGVLFW